MSALQGLIAQLGPEGVKQANEICKKLTAATRGENNGPVLLALYSSLICMLRDGAAASGADTNLFIADFLSSTAETYKNEYMATLVARPKDSDS